MTARIPPWAYVVVVVVCALGTLGVLTALGVLPSFPGGPGPAAGPPAAPPEKSGGALAPRCPIDPATLPPHRAAARAATLAGLLPVYDAAESAGPDRATGRRAVEAYALYMAHSHPPDTLGEYARLHLRPTVLAGCTDPLVRYAEWRVGQDLGYNDPKPERILSLAEELGRTKYPTRHRMRAYFDAAISCPDAYAIPATERRELGRRLAEGFWGAFAECAADPDPVAPAELLEVARELVGRDDPLGGDRQANYTRARNTLQTAHAPEYVLLTLDGLAAARDGVARLGGNPASASPAARTAARPSLERAATALAKAWELNGSSPAAPTEMIAVAFELGRGPDEIQLWCRRATRADPDNPRAWRNELATLTPDRGGSVEAVIAFARRCRGTGNWDGGVPQVGMAALDTARRHRPKFLATPEGWAEAVALFDAWLAAHPGSRAARSFYARAANDFERYDVAFPLFESLENRPWHGAFPDPQAYATAVALSHRGVGRPPSPRNHSTEPTAAEHLIADQSRRTAARAGRRDWFARTYCDAFTRLHPATDKGHAEGLEALAAAANAEAAHFPVGRVADAAWAALDKAVGAGCTDPLVRGLHARFGLVTGEAEADAAARAREAAADLLSSGYPDVVKLRAALDATLAAGDEAESRKRLDEIAPLFGRCSADPDPVTREESLRAGATLLDAGLQLGVARAEVLNRLTGMLVEAKAGPYPGLVLGGIERTAAAREALHAPGDRDTQAEFLVGLREAEGLLRRAWRVAPERPEAQTQLITVGTGLGYPRTEIDRWLARAVDAAPDNYDAIRRLAEYLEPTRNGSRDGIDLLTVCTMTWPAWRGDGAFGLVAYEAQVTARYVHMGARPDDPGVWAEVEHPLKTWQASVPDCRYARTVYALGAVRARQFATADRLFRDLRGRPWPGVFPSPEAYREAAEAARRATGRPPVD